MQKALDRCHIFHGGMGRRKNNLNGGLGCECSENILMLTRCEHNILDGRIPNREVEYIKGKHKDELDLMPKNYRHRYCFARAFGYEGKFAIAIIHHEARNRGETKCSK